MQFDTRDIRLYMDVYTADNVFLGEVRRITPRPTSLAGEQVGESARQASKLSGERLGPMPTEPIGNPAPRVQSARNLYAAQSDGAKPLGQGMLTVANWSGLIGRRTIPLDAVQTVSMERVVLKRYHSVDTTGDEAFSVGAHAQK